MHQVEAVGHRPHLHGDRIVVDRAGPERLARLPIRRPPRGACRRRRSARASPSSSRLMSSTNLARRRTAPRAGARASPRRRAAGRRCGACARRAHGRWRRRRRRAFAPPRPPARSDLKSLREFLGDEAGRQLARSRQRCCCISAARNGMLWRMPSITKASSASACAAIARRARRRVGDELGDHRIVEQRNLASLR